MFRTPIVAAIFREVFFNDVSHRTQQVSEMCRSYAVCSTINLHICSKLSWPTNALKHKMLQLTLQISLYMAPTCFGPFGPSSGSIRWSLAKVTVFVEIISKNTSLK
jgi:hypothetical protein